MILPKYPVYIPSKGRAKNCFTANFMSEDKVHYYLVVEPQEESSYREEYPSADILVLPWSGNDEVRKKFTADREIENGGLIAVRNWIKEHSIQNGFARHWQLDDNIRWVYRRYKGKRLRCNSGIGFRVCEDFTDRYTNIAISGMNYEMFATDYQKISPFYLNNHVYSCSLINNSIPHRWRLAYNDDTDICLQVLADGWCTVLFNAFLIKKMRTGDVKGGNTDDLYQGDGRLRMARALERMWPGVVTIDRRFQRPQHVVKNNWRDFDTQLIRRTDIDWENMKPDNYGMVLKEVKKIKSQALKDWIDKNVK